MLGCVGFVINSYMEYYYKVWFCIDRKISFYDVNGRFVDLKEDICVKKWKKDKCIMEKRFVWFLDNDNWNLNIFIGCLFKFLDMVYIYICMW